MFDSQVSIGPEFFKKAKSDYSSWRYAFVREILQNAIDSTATEISVNVETIDGDIRVTCSDNGCGMSEQILRTKLFSLGSSGKDFKNSVGGFGKAKEILYFCHKSFYIHTNNLEVEGCGGQYKITPTQKIQGTISKIVLDDEWYWKSEFENYFKNYIISSTYSGKFILNGEEINTRTIVTEEVKRLTFGKIYKTDSFKNSIAIRINGMPMFSCATTAEFGLVLELTGKSSDILSANRDSFLYAQGQEFQQFINILSQGSKELILKLSPSIRKYFGKNSCLRSMMKDMEDYLDQIEEENIREEAKSIIWAAENNVQNLVVEDLEKLAEKISSKQIVAKINQDIISIKNYVESEYQTEYDFEVENHFEKEIPEEYLPESFSEYSNYLVSVWNNLLKKILEILNIEQDFYTAFIFHDSIMARYSKIIKSDESSVVRYHINPLGSGMQNGWYWNRNSEDLILTACHEIVHSLGFEYHGESFLNQFHEVVSKVMVHWKEMLEICEKGNEE